MLSVTTVCASLTEVRERERTCEGFVHPRGRRKEGRDEVGKRVD